MGLVVSPPVLLAHVMCALTNWRLVWVFSTLERSHVV